VSPMTAPIIANLSDTARWVAAYRARESARRDALFRDPYAAQLAGEHGERIADAMNRPQGMGNGWPIVMRTLMIDGFVAQSITDGCDGVLNLAAGLDTRPYRLPLPASLPWIEVDLPEILNYKEGVLEGERPVCALERRRVDLSDAAARSKLLQEVGGRFRQMLVITEGLVIYLDQTEVESLSRDLLAEPGLSWWVLDITSPNILSRLQRYSGDQLVHAPVKFAPADGVAFFEARGWHARDTRSLFPEGCRRRRVPWHLRPFALLPDADPRRPDRPWAAAVRLERS
jgi:methyltransferase (TIGR00027 family)